MNKGIHLTKLLNKGATVLQQTEREALTDCKPLQSLSIGLCFLVAFTNAMRAQNSSISMVVNSLDWLIHCIHAQHFHNAEESKISNSWIGT